MNDDNLEKLIRSLKPAPLPADLKTRMRPEPMRPNGFVSRQNITIAAVAAVLIGMVCLAVFLRSDPPVDVVARVSEAPVSVLKKDSTLLSSRILAIEEHEGQLWEVSEEEWRDDTLALCSAGPTKLNSTVIRRELVCSPVKFQ